MKWVIKLENSQEDDIQLVLNYCKEWLSKYDVKKLDEIRIVNTKGMHHTFFGHCSYPNKRKNIGFKVVCYIHAEISFPLKHHRRLSPIYFRKKGVEVPGAYELYDELNKNKDYFFGAHITKGDGTAWVKTYKYEYYYSYDECVAAIFGHEIGHFLSKTKQIKVHNKEIEIDKFEEQFLNEYREFKKNVKF